MIAVQTRKISSPVSRYPGSKRLFLKALLADAKPVDAVIEPFAGAAHYSIARLQDDVDFAFLGEADPTVRSLYQVWKNPCLHPKFLEYVENWKTAIRQDEYSAIARLNSRIEVLNSQKPDSSLLSGGYSLPQDRAATGAILRQLTFGGVVRCNGEGKQNATAVRDQLDKIQRWEPTLDGHEVAKGIAVTPDYKDAIAAFQSSGLFSAEALIDPPYYAPLSECPRRQTPAYWGHEPHSQETLKLCLDAFRRCASDTRIQRIVVTNYISDELHEGLGAIALEHGRRIELIAGQTLKTMQRATGKPGDGAKQGFWQAV